MMLQDLETVETIDGLSLSMTVIVILGTKEVDGHYLDWRVRLHRFWNTYLLLSVGTILVNKNQKKDI